MLGNVTRPGIHGQPSQAPFHVYYSRMSDSATLTWAQVPRPFRILARWITIAQAAGYGVSLAFARQTADRFQPDPGDGVPLAAGAPELLLSAHSHLLGMTALFALSGLCFALCSRPTGRLKHALIATPFFAIMLAFTAVWLMKYAHGFVWVLLAANIVMAVVFYTQIIVTLRELRAARRAEAAAGG